VPLVKPRQLDPAIVCTLFLIQNPTKNCVAQPNAHHPAPQNAATTSAATASRRERGVCVMVAACVARRGAPPPASSPAHSDLYQDVAGRSSTNRHKHEPQSLYSHPQSSPSSSALVRALPRRPKHYHRPDTPVGADLSQPRPSPRQCGTPTPYLGIAACHTLIGLDRIPQREG
jgi:hypothetical protein